MKIKGKSWWLDIKSEHTGHGLINTPTEQLLKGISDGKVSYDNLYLETFNWFRYLVGRHPLDLDSGLNGPHCCTKDFAWVLEVFNDYYDKDTLEFLGEYDE